MLVADTLGRDPAELPPATPFPGGAAVLYPDGAQAWVLIDDGDPRRLAGAWVWAERHRARALNVVVDGGPPGPSGGTAAGLVARRAGYLAVPPRVLAVRGRQAAPAEPEPIDPPAGVPDEVADAWGPELIARGTTPVVEHGLLLAEVFGLEVGRVAPDPDGIWTLAVGVGRHDRDAWAELIGARAPLDVLAEVARDVRAKRTATVGWHPFRRLSRERFLRAVLLADPARVGLTRLTAVPPARPRPDLSAPSPTPMVGVAGDGELLGEETVVACSTGVDVDLVFSGADIRAREAPDAPLVLAVPAGDDHPVTRKLAAALDRPAEVRTVAAGWDAPSL